MAFSRAKMHMELVASIRHGRITNEYNDGARCLRDYLRYAEAASVGDVAAARRVLADLHGRRDGAAEAGEPDAVVGQLAAALRGRGWEVDTGVGLSHFRCHLAVRRPGEAAYRLGVLVDTPEQYAQGDLLARDVMRPARLRAFGWRVAHVRGKDWHEDAAGVVKRVEGEVGGAR